MPNRRSARARKRLAEVADDLPAIKWAFPFLRATASSSKGKSISSDIGVGAPRGRCRRGQRNDVAHSGQGLCPAIDPRPRRRGAPISDPSRPTAGAAQNQKKHAAGTSNSKCPLPGPVPGIYVLAAGIAKVQEDVDAHGSSPWAEGPRVKPGQRDLWLFMDRYRRPISLNRAAVGRNGVSK
jgi:hypothetical protein